MEVKNLTVLGRILAASKLKEYTTGLDTGLTGLTLGLRSEDGRFHQVNIKAGVVNISDFESLFDEKVEVTLEDVSINPYLAGNRAALSVKAKSAFIELV